jgi:hypothetical protein
LQRIGTGLIHGRGRMVAMMIFCSKPEVRAMVLKMRGWSTSICKAGLLFL